MEYKNLLLEIDGPIAVLKVNKPDSLNALSTQVVKELHQALHQIDEDKSVQGVVLTGAGEKAFVSGADIKEMLNMTSFQAHNYSTMTNEMMSFISKMKKPVIAAVNGYALGGGFELALSCDFIYASETAKMGFPEVGLGVTPGFGGTQKLARLIGPARAKEMIFTGKILDAKKALEWGIINEICAPAELLGKTMETLKTICQKGTLAVGFAKHAIVHGLDMSIENGIRYESGLFATLFSTEDKINGMQAFVEKKKPVFQNK